MRKVKLIEINEYIGTTINPADTPDESFELYSVPSFETGEPEIIKGRDIGSTKITVQDGDVLICKINPRINRVWVVNHRTNYQLIASSEWIVVRNKNINSEFLKWYFLSPTFRTLITSQVAGIGGSLTRAQPKQVAQYHIPLFEFDEQCKIAYILNHVDTLIELHKQQLTKLDELVKSRFIELFGDPISNPKGWKTDKAEKYIDLLSGYPFDSSQYTESGINICGGLIIMPQRIEWNDCKHWCSIEGYEEYTLKENDIVIALDRPWISEGFKIAMVDAVHLPALLIQRTARIRATEINQFYLMYCFLLGGFDKHCNVTGSLVPHISAKDIRSFSIMLPPMDLQIQFAAFVEQTDKSKLALQQSLEKLEILKKALMQEYFG